MNEDIGIGARRPISDSKHDTVYTVMETKRKNGGQLAVSCNWPHIYIGYKIV